MATPGSVLVVGSCNTDYILTGVPHLPRPGETVLADAPAAAFRTAQGGKSANAAAAAARAFLGHALGSVSLIACLGDDTQGAASLEAYEDEGIYVGLCKRTRRASSGVAVILVGADGGGGGCSGWRVAIAGNPLRLCRAVATGDPAGHGAVCGRDGAAAVVVAARPAAATEHGTDAIRADARWNRLGASAIALCEFAGAERGGMRAAVRDAAASGCGTRDASAGGGYAARRMAGGVRSTDGAGAAGGGHCGDPRCARRRVPVPPCSTAHVRGNASGEFGTSRVDGAVGTAAGIARIGRRHHRRWRLLLRSAGGGAGGSARARPRRRYRTRPHRRGVPRRHAPGLLCGHAIGHTIGCAAQLSQARRHPPSAESRRPARTLRREAEAQVDGMKWMRERMAWREAALHCMGLDGIVSPIGQHVASLPIMRRVAPVPRWWPAPGA
eukprot:ctg_191.g89